MRAPQAPVWDCPAILARREILVSFPNRPDDAETGAFLTAPNDAVDCHFRPPTNSDVRSPSCHGSELGRVAHGMRCRSVASNALGVGQALTPPTFVKMTAKFRGDSRSVEGRRDEVLRLFVSWANSYTRIGGETFGSGNRAIRFGFSPMASTDLWNPAVTPVGPSDGSRLPAKRMAVLVAAHSVFAVKGVARPTVNQRDLTVAAGFAFRPC